MSVIAFTRDYHKIGIFIIIMYDWGDDVDDECLLTICTIIHAQSADKSIVYWHKVTGKQYIVTVVHSHYVLQNSYQLSENNCICSSLRKFGYNSDSFNDCKRAFKIKGENISVTFVVVVFL